VVGRPRATGVTGGMFGLVLHRVRTGRRRGRRGVAVGCGFLVAQLPWLIPGIFHRGHSAARWSNPRHTQPTFRSLRDPRSPRGRRVLASAESVGADRRSGGALLARPSWHGAARGPATAPQRAPERGRGGRGGWISTWPAGFRAYGRCSPTSRRRRWRRPPGQPSLFGLCPRVDGHRRPPWARAAWPPGRPACSRTDRGCLPAVRPVAGLDDKTKVHDGLSTRTRPVPVDVDSRTNSSRAAGTASQLAATLRNSRFALHPGGP